MYYSIKMSQASNSPEQIFTSFEDAKEAENQAIKTNSKSRSHFNKMQKNRNELLSENGSTTSTRSYSSASSADSDEETYYEDQDSDPDMKLILNALEKSVDNSGMKRQNKTFSEQKIRDIERTNSILMNRILSHNRRANRFTPAPQNIKLSSSAVNRKKQQKQIDHDNLILLRKIQTVKPAVNHQKR